MAETPETPETAEPVATKRNARAAVAAAEPATEPRLTIAAKREGFRRCGIAHSAVGVSYPRGRFSEADIAAMKADPMLVVVES